MIHHLKSSLKENNRHHHDYKRHDRNPYMKLPKCLCSHIMDIKTQRERNTFPNFMYSTDLP